MKTLYPLIRPLLFSMDAEKAHDTSLKMMKWMESSPFSGLMREKRVDDAFSLWGLDFPNRVGLAAGLDKNGACIDALGALGFGFVEVGTVTPRPQEGNPLPRLFRLKEANAIINRMGFNNHGVDQLVENVKASNFNGVLGINIGKNKDTPEENAVDDYIHCMNKVYEHADYITVNISSPNTPGLRNLQFGEALHNLLAAIKVRQGELATQHSKQVPVLVKIAPDLEHAEVEELAETFLTHNIDGIIATNTTSSRTGVEQLQHGNEAGGLSGRPLTEMSTDVLARLNKALKGNIPTIGVGGIHDGQSAVDKINAGASLVQIYSCFIYQGPALIEAAARAIKLARQ
ncbi:quinone-dependent dihydroorotate dehydrogenase [Pleionea sp. CnH1-48]|uniref:quinone-dependent dihydroorotate dehydrogenase n=1 Tax=Pleionea sp. CnH1-48 TaxID=2954494 RepID=UPI002096CB30|nr:quinone-dependent dihydroorotate dehydrogenase [Pleionea sp. CnH1-48]MCO7225398.1 quinone-dependent dihydroorotate dehydrogenase [Pleionea sp. CnH1-48]